MTVGRVGGEDTVEVTIGAMGVEAVEAGGCVAVATGATDGAATVGGAAKAPGEFAGYATGPLGGAEAERTCADALEGTARRAANSGVTEFDARGGAAQLTRTPVCAKAWLACIMVDGG